MSLENGQLAPARGEGKELPKAERKAQKAAHRHLVTAALNQLIKHKIDRFPQEKQPWAKVYDTFLWTRDRSAVIKLTAVGLLEKTPGEDANPVHGDLLTIDVHRATKGEKGESLLHIRTQKFPEDVTIGEALTLSKFTALQLGFLAELIEEATPMGRATVKKMYGELYPQKKRAIAVPSEA